MQWACAILLSVSCLRYPACNAHVSYCRPWPAPFFNIFPYYLINDMIFENKVTEHKLYVSIFSTPFVWNIFYSKNNWARYDRKCMLVLLESTLYSCSILMKLEFFKEIFEKYSNVKFHDNPFSGSRVVACGQTYGVFMAVRFYFIVFRVVKTCNLLCKYQNFRDECCFHL